MMMEQKKKQLKTASILVLIFAVISFAKTIVELFITDFSDIPIPDGVPENIWLIAKISFGVIFILLLTPQFYIGVKGLKLAKNPDRSAKAHIVWGIILLVLAVLALISPIASIVQKQDVLTNVSLLFGMLLDVLVLFDYVKCAKALAK